MNNYALGQVMLYVDGMNGVIEHNETIQWLYSLISSKFRLVVKTSLKLLLVFVEYTESNTNLLLQAINIVDRRQGHQPWHNVMTLLKDEQQDNEILVYTMTLVNKVLNAIPDQDTFYDVTDSLEELGIDKVQKSYMHRNSDPDLQEQFNIYEASLKHEDGDADLPMERHKDLRQRQRISDTVQKERKGKVEDILIQ
ncbi:FH1/FH2 domain-containing protein 3-like [Saccoglossus kowalevskii]